MQFNYKRTTIVLAVALILSLLVTFSVLAGNIDSPSAPTDPASQMYTLENIYDRLSSNGNSVKATTFTEPLATPYSTMHTLDDIYALSYPARVQATGQTECYDTAGAVISCTGTGQDGELQKGVTWTEPRFTINGDNNSNGDCIDAGDTCDGTVTDNLTGLIWLTDTHCAGSSRLWATALADVVSLNTSGEMNGNNCGDISNLGTHQMNWRLPNVREITSLLHYGIGTNHVSIPNTAGTGEWSQGDPFNNLQTYYYWTGTTMTLLPERAWRVGVGISTLSHINKGDVIDPNDGSITTPAGTGMVWPVRGGQ